MNRQDVEKTITEYLKPIFGFALKRCKSIHDAEDLSQEITIRAFHALLIKEDIADMGKFIWTVAHGLQNVAISKPTEITTDTSNLHGRSWFWQTMKFVISFSPSESESKKDTSLTLMS